MNSLFYMTSYCQQAFQVQSAIIHTAYLHVLLYDQTLLSPCESAVTENSAFTICFAHILCTGILVDASRFVLFTKSAVHLQPGGTGRISMRVYTCTNLCTNMRTNMGTHMCTNLYKWFCAGGGSWDHKSKKEEKEKRWVGIVFLLSNLHCVKLKAETPNPQNMTGLGLLVLLFCLYGKCHFDLSCFGRALKELWFLWCSQR